MKNIYPTTILMTIFFVLFSCGNNPAPENKPNAVSLEEMVGQMIMVGFRGLTIDEVSPSLLSQLDSGLIGSLILFDYDVPTKSYHRNIESPAQVKLLVSELQKHAKIPLLVAIDQEGGVINRLKPRYGFPRSVSAQYLGDLDNLDTTRYYGQLNATTLNDLGLNLNFAPVVDMNVNPDNPVIAKYERSYSADADRVVKHASVWIEMHHNKGVLSTLKHFPGHGSSAADSHQGFTDVSNTWTPAELKPFRKLCQHDGVAVMTAHVFNSKLDSIYPATLSENVIKKILRDEWHFDGLVFSDDLQMKAVNALFDFETIIKRSILSGVDVLTIGNNLEYDENVARKMRETVLNLVRTGQLDPNRIKKSYERVMTAKRQLGLLK